MSSMLPSDVRAWIVRRLACFERPKEVVKAVEEHFELEIKESQVRRLNPLLNDKLDESLVTLFWRARRAFEDGIDDVGISHKVYRLRELQRLYEEARDRNHTDTCLEILDRASKEVGGVHERAGNVNVLHIGKFMDELAGVVAQEVEDPEQLRRIESGIKALPPPKG